MRMTKKKESVIQREIILYLKSIGAYVVKVIRATENGVPDILFCLNGTFNAIEVKATGKKKQVSELQKIHLEMISASGGKTLVADDVWDVMEIW